MTPDEMPIVEATQPLKFASKLRLQEHVLKHVIDGRDERWHQLIDSELLGEARSECREGRKGDAFASVARRYQELVGTRLVKVCRKDQSHQHVCCYKWNVSDSVAPSKKAVKQKIEAWPAREKLFIVAAAVVRNDRIGPYRLLTAYRPYPQLSERAHQRKTRERARNRNSLDLRYVLATHDQ